MYLQRPISAGRVAEVVEHLLRKREDRNSNASTAEKKKFQRPIPNL
jgi:hypothetical protein